MRVIGIDASNLLEGGGVTHLQELLQHSNPITNNFDKILLSIIPDIESVNYGRGVGYEVIYHEPPTDVAQISGTAIRNGEMNNDGSTT